MKILVLIYSLLILAACGSSHDVVVDDSEHIAYVSIAQTWREVCEDRFNMYDYPNSDDRNYLQAECRRRFATGEETIDFPEFPTDLPTQFPQP